MATDSSSILSKLQNQLKNVPIVYRLLVGNSIIAFSAVAGTLLTHEYTQIPETTLIAFFAIIGFFTIFLFNYFTIQISLRSLAELQLTIDQINLDNPSLPESIVLDTDPDLRPLADSINAMLVRLERSNRQLRALSERATHAQEEERRRIARNLHDDTSQSLSSLIISLERLESDLPPDAVELKPRLIQARQITTRTLEDLRNIIYDLRPTMLDDLGLIPAVRWFARTTLEGSGIQVTFQTSEEPLRLPGNLETELFRIAQEGVNNIFRHSNADHVIIRLSQEPDHICLEMEDDGSGFDVERTADTALSQKRLGLLGIKERAALVGGSVLIDSQPGKGTLLQVCIPCTKS